MGAALAMHDKYMLPVLRVVSVDDLLCAKLLPFLLSVIAGSVDVIGFLGLGGLLTAHVTGNCHSGRACRGRRRSLAGFGNLGSRFHRRARRDTTAGGRPGSGPHSHFANLAPAGRSDRWGGSRPCSPVWGSISATGMSATIAHEFKQPLTAIVTDARAAVHWLDRTPPNVGEAQDALNRIVKGADRADSIVRIKSGRFTATSDKGEAHSHEL